MPKLNRSDWYDLARDMNWDFKYVTYDEVFPPEIAGNYDVPEKDWYEWDESYKITYREYVHNQCEKDAGVYSVKSALSRSKLFEHLDPGWVSSLKAHYGAMIIPEILAVLAESRMSRFGRAAAWRNMALFGTLDETRHTQIQLLFAHGLLEKDIQFDWTHKGVHTNDWAIIAARHLCDDMFTASDAIATALQLTFTLEAGFTNVQFLGMAADALDVGDIEFGALISSIQTDESRHAQQGEPTLKILLKQGKEIPQKLIDTMFWRSWRIFALLTGLSMDYYTPLEHRQQSFKEFMEEWILKQFVDLFRDLGLELPWYWDLLLEELEWYHHAIHLGVWTWRPTLWWNPDAGVSPPEREWLQSKYPNWEKQFGPYWDVITENIRNNRIELTYPETFPAICNLCQLPIVSTPSALEASKPRVVKHKERVYQFCCEPCKWIFEQNPERYAGHLSIVDRLLAGHIQPPTIAGALAYMGITPDVAGDDADKYAWASIGCEKTGERKAS